MTDCRVHPGTQELLERRATQETLVTLVSLDAQVSEASPDQMALKETKDSRDFLVYLDDKDVKVLLGILEKKDLKASVMVVILALQDFLAPLD